MTGGQPEAGADLPLKGPPGQRIFSLEGRRGPGLYLVAWLASGSGVGLLFVAGLTQPPARWAIALAGFTLLAAGLASAAGYQLLARGGRPTQAYRGPSPLILFGIFLALVNSLALVLSLFGFDVGPDDVRTPGAFLLAIALQAAAYVLVVWLFVVRAGALSWHEMGLPRRESAARALADAGFAAGVMLPTTFIALIGGGLIALLLGVRPPEVVPLPTGMTEIIAVALGAAILAPVSEEVFFRGFALTAWWRDLGLRSALIRATLFFALIHLINIQSVTFDVGLRQAAITLAVILPIGLVLGWLYIRRGLIAPIVGHITYNATLVVLLIGSQSTS